MNKQKLQEQIDTMRAELAKMETELAESEKVELVGGGTYMFTDCNGIRFVKDSRSSTTVKSGATRATRKLAEIASKNMVARNKLEAYAHQIDPEWRDKEGSIAACIHKDGEEYSFLVSDIRRIGAVYMSISTAEQICEWLNYGKIEL